jgi:Fe-S cluster assembly iron-binding protein IscA
MLFLTDRACEAILQLATTSRQTPEEAGVRISALAGDGSPRTFELVLVDAPQTGDTILESRGARVYLDDVADRALDEAILDAHFDPASHRIEFQLT